MVAKIKSGKSLIGLLNYNERKVGLSKARLIHAVGYLKENKDLSFDDKLIRLTDLAARNYRTVTNALHVSLNFDPQENHDEDKLIRIADSYMDGIGFGGQPYLVYQHFDAGHPHIHIVSTNIQRDGTRISLHNIGKDKSEPVRKAIEKNFNLVSAESQVKKQDLALLPKMKPVVYGTAETKCSVSQVVTGVFKNYRYTSLNEFNTILEYFNVNADRGSSKTIMYHHHGLRYWIMDEKRKRIGVPIKASSIYSKPTLTELEKQFHLNAYLRKPAINTIRNKVDESVKWASDVQSLLTTLKSKGIHMVVHRNAEGHPFGATFIDHEQKVVVKASDLGKAYSAQKLLQGLPISPVKEASQPVLGFKMDKGQDVGTDDSANQSLSQPGLLDTLLAPTGNANEQPNSLIKKKKKRKKKLNL